MSTDLDIRVREALVERKGQWQQIAATCEVSHSWISQFVRNKIPNPGYGTLKRLEAQICANEGDPRRSDLGPGARVHDKAA